MDYDLFVVTRTSEEPKAVEEKLAAILKKDNFTLSGFDCWGKKLLAYPIKKQTEGVYSSATISGNGNSTVFHARFKQEDSIVRALILKKLKPKKTKKVVAVSPKEGSS